MHNLEQLMNCLDNIVFVEDLIKQNVSKECILNSLKNTGSIPEEVTSDDLSFVLTNTKKQLLSDIDTSNEGWLETILWTATKNNRVKEVMQSALAKLKSLDKSEQEYLLSKRLGVGGYSEADSKLMYKDLLVITTCLKKYVSVINKYGKIIDFNFKDHVDVLTGELKPEFKKGIKEFNEACTKLYNECRKDLNRSQDAYYKRHVSADQKTLKELGFTVSNIAEDMKAYVDNISDTWDVIKQLANLSQKYAWTTNKQVAREDLEQSDEMYYSMTYYSRRSLTYIRLIAEISYQYYIALDKEFYSIAKGI